MKELRAGGEVGMTTVLQAGKPVIWNLLPNAVFILKYFHVRRDGTHVAVIVEDKAYGLGKIVPTDELQAAS